MSGSSKELNGIVRHNMKPRRLLRSAAMSKLSGTAPERRAYQITAVDMLQVEPKAPALLVSIGPKEFRELSPWPPSNHQLTGPEKRFHARFCPVLEQEIETYSTLRSRYLVKN